MYSGVFLTNIPQIARNVTSDVRNFYAHKLRACSVRHVMYHLYPRMLAIHDLEDTIALPDPDTGRLSLPTLMRANHLYMSANGVYIIGG
jgi:protein transport protein SEC24